MKKFTTIILVTISINTIAQEVSDSQILNLMFAPSIDLSADSIYDEKGKPKKMYGSLFYDQIIIDRTLDISNQNIEFQDLVKKGLANIEQSTFIDFQKKNAQSIKIDSLKIHNRKTILIDKAKAQKVITKNKWTKLKKEFPNSNPVIISISKIGYNKKKTQALFYSTNHNSFGGQYGFYTLFVLEKDKWSINQSVMIGV